MLPELRPYRLRNDWHPEPLQEHRQPGVRQLVKPQRPLPAGHLLLGVQQPPLLQPPQRWYSAPGLGWYTLAGEELNIFFSPYPDRGSLAMTPSSTCSKSVSGRPAAPGDVAPEDAIVLFQ